MDYRDPKPFQFKQFEVHHHLSTFKVNTDGVLLGCLADLHDCRTALDIGTGTGMIGLMLAQKYDAVTVTGIEVNEISAKQATYNCEVSPYTDRITIINADCFDYPYEHQYDLIVCNPPYFEGGTLPQQSNLSQAKHSNAQFLPRLIKLVEVLLNPQGKFQFLYPSNKAEMIDNLIDQSSLHLTKKTLLKSYVDSQPYACVYTLEKQILKDTNVDTLVLYKHDRVFTTDHLDLTREYYLWA